MNNSELLSRLKTTEEREKAVAEVELLLRSLYGSRENSFQRTLEGSVRSWVGEIISEEIKDKNAEEYLEKLKNDLEKMEEVRLGIAYDPSSSSLAKIHDKLIKIAGKNILIDLTVNKAIVGGAVVVYKGRYKDLSMKKIFEAEMMDIRDEILKIMDRNTENKIETRN